MKNIHVIPTEKPSRVFLNKVNNKLLLEDVSNLSLKNVLPSGSYQNIYITSEEEIKEGEYGLSSLGKVVKFTEDGIYNYSLWKKIILATDPDLIADGVQAIDNEFLQWFVKNPKCEEVEVKKRFSDFTANTFVGYQIVIPTEEPKQDYKKLSEEFTETLKSIPDDVLLKYAEPNKETLRYICPQTKKQCDDECCVSAKDCHIESGRGILSDSKQETIEEAAERELEYFHEVSRGFDFDLGFKTGMVKGAEWQAKRMYSKEKVNDLLDILIEQNMCSVAGDELIQQFKKQKS